MWPALIADFTLRTIGASRQGHRAPTEFSMILSCTASVPPAVTTLTERGRCSRRPSRPLAAARVGAHTVSIVRRTIRSESDPPTCAPADSLRRSAVLPPPPVAAVRWAGSGMGSRAATATTWALCRPKPSVSQGPVRVQPIWHSASSAAWSDGADQSWWDTLLPVASSTKTVPLK